MMPWRRNPRAGAARSGSRWRPTPPRSRWIRRAIDQHHVVAIAHGLDDVPQADLQVARRGPRLRIVVLHARREPGTRSIPGISVRWMLAPARHRPHRPRRRSGRGRGRGWPAGRTAPGEAGLRIVIDQQNPLSLLGGARQVVAGRGLTHPALLVQEHDGDGRHQRPTSRGRIGRTSDRAGRTTPRPTHFPGNGRAFLTYRQSGGSGHAFFTSRGKAQPKGHLMGAGASGFPGSFRGGEVAGKTGPKQINVMSSNWACPPENSWRSRRMVRMAFGPSRGGSAGSVAADFPSSRTVPRGALGVGHAVGVDEDGVAGVEIKVYLPVFGVRRDSERKPADIQTVFLDAAIGPPDQGWRVSRRAVGDRRGPSSSKPRQSVMNTSSRAYS